MVNKGMRLWALMMAAALLAAGAAGAAAPEPQRVKLEVSQDVDYDTNTSQQSDRLSDATIFPNQGSLVLTQNFRGEFYANPKGPFDFQLKYHLFSNFHTRASNVDTMMQTVTASPSYLFGQYRNIKFWVPFAFNSTEVDSSKYFSSYSLTPSLFHRVSKAWGYALEMRLARRYGWVQQMFPVYDYTSRNAGASVGCYRFLDNGGYLQARLGYDYVDAAGDNITHSAYKMLISGEYPFTGRLTGIFYLEMTLRSYDHQFQNFSPIFTYPKRKDKALLFGAVLEYRIYKGMIGSVHYYVNRQESNVGFYDFTSHIFGGQLAYRY